MLIGKIRRKLFWYVHFFAGALNNKPGLFKQGMTIDIIPTTRCNYKCSYCPMFLHGEVKKFKECTWEGWADFITRRVQHWVSVFYVSGGEPALYADIVPLINWLIKKKHKVILLTNLSYPEKFEGIKPHWRLMFQPTFHEEFADMKKFKAGIEWLRQRGYGITSQVTGTDERPAELKKMGALKRIKEFYTADWFQNHDPNIQAGPDTPRTSRLFIGSANLYRKDGWE